MDFPAWRRAQAFSQESRATTYWSDGLTEKKQRLRSFSVKRSIAIVPSPPEFPKGRGVACCIQLQSEKTAHGARFCIGNIHGRTAERHCTSGSDIRNMCRAVFDALWPL